MSWFPKSHLERSSDKQRVLELTLRTLLLITSLLGHLTRVEGNRWILCCLILHNIVLFCNDQWELDAADHAQEAQDRAAVAAMVNRPPASSALGVLLRDRVKRDIQDMFY